MEKQYWIKRAERLVEDNKDKNKALDAYRKMYHLDYDLPDSLDGIDWIRKYVSPDPHDAVAVSIRVLSALWPRIEKLPLAPGERNKARAAEEEKVLDFNLRAMNRLRRGKSLVADITQSALLYDNIAIYINDLENEKKIRGDASSARLDRALDTSRFSATAYYPGNVYSRESSYGLENVLLYQERRAHELRAEWGDKVNDLFSDENDTNDQTWIRYYDFTDLKERAIWCMPTHEGSEPIWLMEPKEHNMDFWAWIIVASATDLEHSEEFKAHPMLFPLYYGGSWDTQNIVRSLNTSEVIARFGSPRYIEEGPNRRRMQIDYFNPARIAKAPVGNTVRELRPPLMDEAMLAIDDRIAMDIQKATVSRLLSGGDIPSGTAYATLNLATQTAIGALKPAKELSEVTIARMCEVVLRWCKFTGVPLTGLGTGKSSGEQYVIEPGQIDTRGILITASLSPDVPSDQLRRANTANMLVQLGYPRARALQDVGVNDPEMAMNEARFDQYVDHLYQMKMEGDRMQMQMGMQAMMAQMQGGGGGGGAPAEGGGQPSPEELEMMAAMQQGAEGQGFDPNMGGESPVSAMPEDEFMREAVLDEDLTGAAVMPPEL